VHEVFGLTTKGLAGEILDRWNLPANYGRYFRRVGSGDASRANPGDTLFAIVDVAADCARNGEATADTQGMLDRSQQLLALASEELLSVVRTAKDALREQAPILGIDPPPAPRAKTAAAATHAAAAGTNGAKAAAGATKPGSGSGSVRPDEGAAHAAPGAPSSASAASAQLAFEIIGEITHSILEHDDINNILCMVLEGIARTGPFDAVFLALLTVQRDRLVGRLGYGQGVEEYLSKLVVPLRPGAGLLAETVLARKSRIVSEGSPGLLVPAGATLPKVAAASFVVHPIIVRDKVVGVLYAARNGAPAVGAADLALVQLFCNQACLALSERVS
jgi:GAF domain-containing protein